MFIPLIAGMAGNTGTQALAVVVRGLAVNEFKSRDVLWLLWREAGVGLIVGTVNGLLIAAVAWLWQGNPWLGFVIGLTLWVTLFVATMAGAVVPLLLNRIRVDPAVASGPFITTINDIIGLTIYFTVATAFMGRLI
ncbi:MAG: magnesium transporter [bacterium]